MADLPPSVRRPFDERAAAATLARLVRMPGAPWLHEEIARRLAERLEIVRMRPGWVLEWWSALGGTADVLDAVYPDARRTLIEPDERWARRSRDAHARPWWSPQHWRGPRIDVCVESADIAPGAQLVVANMVLHAVADPPALFQHWERLLALDGFIMFSCPGPDTLLQLRDLYARLGWPPPAAPFIDMHDLGDMLVAAGFADPVMDQETLTLHWGSPEALLTELRRLGGNTAPDRFAGLRTRRWRDRLLAELEHLRGADGRIALAFEIAYGHAFKAPPRLRAETPTRIPLDDMRRMVRGRRGPPS